MALLFAMASGWVTVSSGYTWATVSVAIPRWIDALSIDKSKHTHDATH